ncbi:hypothetical protein LCGC14_1764640, partial [marine sediment metagenome]
DLIVLFNAYSTTGTNQTQILTDYIIASIIIEEAEAGAPQIPGYEPLIVIGATIIAYIGVVVVKKKK